MHPVARTLDFLLKGRALKLGNMIYCINDKMQLCVLSNSGRDDMVNQIPMPMTISDFILICSSEIGEAEISGMDYVDCVENNQTRH